MREDHFRKVLLVLGHGVFIALLVLAWEHGIMRTTFGDSAFQIFQWVSQPGWDIEAHRYTAIVPQAVVKLFALFGAELRTLLMIASLAHALVAYAVFVLCAHGWKAERAAIACAVAAVLCTRLTFYSPVLEANYLLVFPFLLIGYVERKEREGLWSVPAIVVACLLALVSLIVHPAGWMVLSFCIVALFALRWIPLRPFLALIGCSLAWPLVSRWIFPPTGYEIAHYAAVGAGLSQLSGIGSWGSWEFLRIHTFTATNTYLPALLVWGGTVIAWIRLRNRWMALLSLGGPLAFLGVFLVTFHSGDAAIMMDRGVLPVATLIAVCAVPLLWKFDGRNARWAMVGVLCLVLFVKLRDVSFASRGFRKHMDATKVLIAEAERQHVKRGLVGLDRITGSGLEVNWAFPCESLLRSAVNGPEQACILRVMDRSPAAALTPEDDLELLGHVYPLPQRFFGQPAEPFVPLR